MKRMIAPVALILTSLLGLGPVNAARADTLKEEAQLRGVNAQEVLALQANDRKTLKKIWHDEFHVTNPFNRFVDKKQVLDMLDEGTLAFSSLDRNIEYIRIYDHTAVVVGSETVVWAGKMPGAGNRSTVRFTSVWLEKGDTWQEVARHASMVLGP
jgi:hypothetical protein